MRVAMRARERDRERGRGRGPARERKRGVGRSRKERGHRGNATIQMASGRLLRKMKNEGCLVFQKGYVGWRLETGYWIWQLGLVDLTRVVSIEW